MDHDATRADQTVSLLADWNVMSLSFYAKFVSISNYMYFFFPAGSWTAHDPDRHNSDPGRDLPSITAPDRGPLSIAARDLDRLNAGARDPSPLPGISSQNWRSLYHALTVDRNEIFDRSHMQDQRIKYLCTF